jgi:hypothetical protein
MGPIFVHEAALSLPAAIRSFIITGGLFFRATWLFLPGCPHVIMPRRLGVPPQAAIYLYCLR